MKRHFEQRAVDRLFQPGDKVLLLLPYPGSARSVKLSGPYVVEKNLSKTNDIIQTPNLDVLLECVTST